MRTLSEQEVGSVDGGVIGIIIGAAALLVGAIGLGIMIGQQDDDKEYQQCKAGDL